jgi:hypothetical protein
VNVDECQIDTVVERLEAFHAIKSMHNIRGELGWERVANELVNRICVVSDKYFCLFLLHQKCPLSAHQIEPTALKMRRDPKRSRPAGELTSSWLICAWISEKILSQLSSTWRHTRSAPR